jgi:hypothetical protein
MKTEEKESLKRNTGAAGQPQLNSEKYYFITSDTSKIGVPILLEAGLYDKFTEKDCYIKEYWYPPAPTPTPAWNRPINAGIEMPEQLFLINKHRKIDFDFYPKEYGFIISSKFKEIIDQIKHPSYVASKLQVVTRENEVNTKKDYWYIKFYEKSMCIDFEKSDLKLFPNSFDINKYLTKLVLDSKKFTPKELFYIETKLIKDYLFCNEETAAKLKKIKTIKIIEIELLFEEYINYITRGKTKIIIE